MVEIKRRFSDTYWDFESGRARRRCRQGLRWAAVFERGSAGRLRAGLERRRGAFPHIPVYFRHRGRGARLDLRITPRSNTHAEAERARGANTNYLVHAHGRPSAGAHTTVAAALARTSRCSLASLGRLLAHAEACGAHAAGGRRSAECCGAKEAGSRACGRSAVASLPSVLPRSARSPPSRLRLVSRKPAAQTQRAVVGQRKPAAQRMRAVEGAGVQRILGIGRYRESLRRTHDLASADRAREVVRGRCAPALPRQTACGAQRRR